ncbi:MAG: flagellar basal-body rod protein FlgF [Betaproteobacteria bacterium]|nr:flagellar basal-body rod protein FlgF [Betaproteobacteria bacterium]
MFQALFNGLSGLFAFSQSLNVISNNVANMNTPGFRGSDSFFANLFEGDGAAVVGQGVSTQEGSLQQTGNPTDVAISGQGFFILKDPQGNLYYTRAGQFQFNNQGYLVDTVYGYRVQAIDANGNLTDINVASFNTLPPQATTTVQMTGNLSTQSPTDSVTGIQIYDAQGNAHTYTATFTNNTATTPGSWTVSITDSQGNVVTNGEIRFGTDGTPQTGYNTLTLNLTFQGTAQAVTFNFGTPGTLSGATQFSGTASNLAAQVQNGHSALPLTTESFDQNGVLQLTYSDGEKQAGPQLALAYFADESGLQQLQGRLYSGNTTQQRQIGRANQGVFGQISGGSLELSNVNLTQELAEMIVVQSGFQANSQVLTVANSMLQQLYNSTRPGG